jgi:hypothetical protein|tara:strand:- start:835 stop:996 length:162 start_codon:yes stop_codon:yes gene_type:complete
MSRLAAAVLKVVKASASEISVILSLFSACKTQLTSFFRLGFVVIAITQASAPV